MQAGCRHRLKLGGWQFLIPENQIPQIEIYFYIRQRYLKTMMKRFQLDDMAEFRSEWRMITYRFEPLIISANLEVLKRQEPTFALLHILGYEHRAFSFFFKSFLFAFSLKFYGTTDIN